jgi:toxin ParE1/3/4
MEIEISDDAYFDIEGILQISIETFGIIKAEEYSEKIFNKIILLSESPGIGHNHKYLPTNLRVTNLERHIIIYHFSEEEEQIKILRIVHQKINLGDLF